MQAQQEQDELIKRKDELIQRNHELEILIAEFEARQLAQASMDEKILDSFMDNLDEVAKFLGLDELNISREDINIYSNFVMARSAVFGSGIELTFRYSIISEGIKWTLLEYIIGPISGPGYLDSGRGWWQEFNEKVFDEAFIMRVYLYEDLWPEPVGEYVEVEISPDEWQRQVIYHMRAHLGIQIADLWYEGSHLVVDLTPAGAIPFNWGSFGGAVLSSSFIDSLATLPNVSEVKVLVGGQRGVGADHFRF